MTFELLQPTLHHVRGRTGVKWGRYEGRDVLSAWVADMDFDAPGVAIEAMQALLDSGSTGYGDYPGNDLVAAWSAWQDERFGWAPDTDRIRCYTSVLHALEVALMLRTAPGDGVVVFMPIYHPFLHAIDDSGRRRIEVPLEPTTGRLDPERLHAAIDDTTTAILLCQPHNPTGRMFDADEVAAIADVAVRHDLLVLSDEIWGDLTHERPHVPLALADERFSGRLVTCASASKTFNLAGTRAACAHIDDLGLNQTLDSMASHTFGAPSTLGIAAAIACWQGGQPWLSAITAQLLENRTKIAERLASECPEIGFEPPEATYLAWFDFRDTAIAADPMAALFSGGVALSPGDQFGAEGVGWARMNFATSPEILDQLLDRIIGAVHSGQ